ncbi:hypothetical protein PSHT_09947, partial [Puccinia striiformis]
KKDEDIPESEKWITEQHRHQGDLIVTGFTSLKEKCKTARILTPPGESAPLDRLDFKRGLVAQLKSSLLPELRQHTDTLADLLKPDTSLKGPTPKLDLLLEIQAGLDQTLEKIYAAVGDLCPGGDTAYITGNNDQDEHLNELKSYRLHGLYTEVTISFSDVYSPLFDDSSELIHQLKLSTGTGTREADVPSAREWIVADVSDCHEVIDLVTNWLEGSEFDIVQAPWVHDKYRIVRSQMMILQVRSSMKSDHSNIVSKIFFVLSRFTFLPMLPDTEGSPTQNYYEAWLDSWNDLFTIATNNFEDAGLTSLMDRCEAARRLPPTEEGAPFDRLDFKRELVAQLQSSLFPELRQHTNTLADLLQPDASLKGPTPKFDLLLEIQAGLHRTLEQIYSAVQNLCPGGDQAFFTGINDQHLKELKPYRLNGLYTEITMSFSDVYSALFGDFGELFHELKLSTGTGTPSADVASTRECILADVSDCHKVIDLATNWLEGSEFDIVQAPWVHEKYRIIGAFKYRISNLFLLISVYFLPIVPDIDGFPTRNYYKSWLASWKASFIIAINSFVDAAYAFQDEHY